MDTYRLEKHRVNEPGRDNTQAVNDYKQLVLDKDKLFDVATDDPNQKKKCEESWGVKMGLKEKHYLEKKMILTI